MNNTGIILTLAYPETIVMVADEWYSPYLRYLGVGKKNYVRAGHAALVLINKETGVLEYHDFGRYITPEPNARVRGNDTDCELIFPIKAHIENGTIVNLEEIIQFLSTHPRLTHGDGTMYLSECDTVDYNLARKHITMMQDRHFIRYAAFVKDGCNCARFVTDTLIASVTNSQIKNKLIKSKRFTPSTVGNVVIADTKKKVYQVSDTGSIQPFESSVGKINRTSFLDRLKGYEHNLVGTIYSKSVNNTSENAQWLSGIAAGAWFELFSTETKNEYIFKRISPYGNVDVEAIYTLETSAFNHEYAFEFIHYSNCKFFHVKQNDKVYKFNRKTN